MTENPHETNNLLAMLEKLNGYKPPLLLNEEEREKINSFPLTGVGFSQFNELQLTLGYNRINRTFYQYLLNGSVIIDESMCFTNFAALEEGINNFRVLALLFFGNIGHAFTKLSVDSDELNLYLTMMEKPNPSAFTTRHNPVHPLKEISGKDSYYLGHIIQKRLLEDLQQNPQDKSKQDEFEHSKKIVENGKNNYRAYLASDHLDVYIATSMRTREDYYTVHKWVKILSNTSSLVNLKLRWFDPTQSFCEDRIDKGLFEALMLKRAKCTIYFAQESDTLGKDSELASTLAQGKTVIAFIPTVTEEFVDEFINNLHDLYPEKSEQDIIIEKLKEYNPRLAWEDDEVRVWLNDETKFQVIKAKEKLSIIISKKYKERAKVLSEWHPLGIQMNLETGVANGVLVVRDLDKCAKIIEQVVTKSMEFYLEEQISGSRTSLFLKEVNSNCIYRLATGDQMLSNTFWNFYPSPTD
ncbi:MAG: hypothetical protein U9R53_01620 [Chloroflexota bacterium]|nr:hypothetical protein [Chloroflexota bacterium]